MIVGITKLPLTLTSFMDIFRLSCNSAYTCSIYDNPAIRKEADCLSWAIKVLKKNTFKKYNVNEKGIPNTFRSNSRIEKHEVFFNS